MTPSPWDCSGSILKGCQGGIENTPEYDDYEIHSFECTPVCQILSSRQFRISIREFAITSPSLYKIHFLARQRSVIDVCRRCGCENVLATHTTPGSCFLLSGYSANRERRSPGPGM